MSINAVESSSLGAAQASNINMQDFLKILLTQLTYQDPLKPMDNQQFMAQMAQFTALQQTQQLNSKIDTLVANQTALQSISLIGKSVDVTADAGIISGTVTALNLASSTPELTLQTAAGTTVANIKITQVQKIQ
jgi:flagellar basal-body rod modification protein FlgD